MNKICDLIKETLRGKSFYRLLFNWSICEHCRGLSGVSVDLACGKKSPSYWRYWQIDMSKLTRIDFSQETEPDIVANLNQPVPLKDDFADNVFMFNSLYLLENPRGLIGEIRRVLKPSGRAFVTAQFIKSEESQATDRYRFTSRLIKEIFLQAGFSEIKIYQIGACFSAAGNLVDFAIGSSLLSRLVKLIFRPLCLLADKLTPKKLRMNYPCPIAWLAVAKK